jgi:hypothetical protein
MGTKPLVHRGSKSMWSGKFTALCGITIPAGVGRSPWFTSPARPACEAAHKAKKSGK